jgi:Carboxypeptidase regulatory-like domain
LKIRNVQPHLAIAIALAAAVPALAQAQRLVGTVTDSVHRAPLRNATVVATPIDASRDSVFHSARTDAKGRFELDSLALGRYSISIEHAFTDSIGLDVPSRIVAIAATGTTETALAFPSVATLRRTLCPAALTDTTLGVMLGVVRNADGSPAAGSRVVVGWSDLSTDRTTLAIKRDERTASTTADSLGVYRACGVPAAVTLLVQAQSGSKQSGIINEQIGEAAVLVRDFTLGSEVDTTGGSVAAGGASSGSAGLGVVTGSVEGAHGEKISAARVTLVGTAHSASVDENGAFRFTGLPTGTQGFEVVALGYLPRRFRAEVTRDTRIGVVKLDKSVVVLDSIRVVARRRYDTRAYPEFEERLRHRPIGRFVTEEMIDRQHPFLLSDMLRMMPGITMHAAPNGDPILTCNRSSQVSLVGLLPKNAVQPGSERRDENGSEALWMIYIDGVPDASADVNRLLPSAVHGMEVYHRNEAPAQYPTGICGAIVIWSK